MNRLILVFIVNFVLIPAVLAGGHEHKPAASEDRRPAMAHHRAEQTVTVSLDDSAQAELWKPDLSRLPLTIHAGQILLPKTGVDNYHAVVVQQRQDNINKAVIRYIYRYGRPSGHSARELTAANKAELEIVPDPVPREHDHYFTGQNWDFIVRFRGDVLPNQRVMLTTENGTTETQTTDDNGKVTFLLPDDFPDIKPGERDQRSAVMYITAQLEKDGQQWHTQLEADYFVSQSHWQSSFWGGIVVLLGFLFGTLFLRFNKDKAGKK